ncbi:hypothetical protein OHA25_42715 [Nonomuraea sp. NBC_00507]|uniref:hypothetical protein n=1 Tax=Nonomuraea sp. NBC_00507 TaxID=2976002 RepID=UPI002E196E49
MIALLVLVAEGSPKIYTLFEGTSEIQRLIVGLAVTGLPVKEQSANMRRNGYRTQGEVLQYDGPVPTWQALHAAPGPSDP